MRQSTRHAHAVEVRPCGLRLGLSRPAAGSIDVVEKVRLPYNVGVLTQLVAEAVRLERRELAEQAAHDQSRARAAVAASLQRCPA